MSTTTTEVSHQSIHARKERTQTISGRRRNEIQSIRGRMERTLSRECFQLQVSKASAGAWSALQHAQILDACRSSRRRAGLMPGGRRLPASQ